MGITEQHRVLVLNDTTNASLGLDLPSKPSVATDGATPFDHVVIFVKQQSELNETFPLQKRHLTQRRQAVGCVAERRQDRVPT